MHDSNVPANQKRIFHKNIQPRIRYCVTIRKLPWRDYHD